MKIMYSDGKRSNHVFMPFAKITDPENYDHKLPASVLRYFEDDTFRFYQRKNCLKTVLRLIRKQNYPVGTLVVVPSWYVGYADLVIII